MSGKYAYLKRPGSIIHLWSINQKNSLCSMWKYLSEEQKKLYTVYNEIPNGKNFCSSCQEKLERIIEKENSKKPRMAITRPEEEEYLRRWKGARHTHPTFWEKMDQDPAYNRTVKRKYGDDPIYYDKVPQKPWLKKYK